MALNIEEMIKFNTEQPEETKLSLTQVARLRKLTREMLWENFRIELGEDGRVPMGEGGAPRILIYGKDKDGREGLQDPNALGILPGSAEFVRECEKGNVLVYPAGKEKPVQLQAWTNKPSEVTQATFSITKEVDPENLPLPPVKKMGFLRGLARVLTLGIAYRGRAREIANAKRQQTAAKAKLRGWQTERARTVQKELDRMPQLEKAHADRLKQKVLDEDLKKAVTAENEKTVGMRNFVSIFRPDPEFLPELEKVTEEKDGKQKKEGVYTPDQFKDLTVFSKDAEQLRARQDQLIRENEEELKDLPPQERGKRKLKPCEYEEFDLNGIKLGPDSKPLTNEEFAGVAMFACWQPKLAMEEYRHGNDYDPTLRQALKNCGIPEDKLGVILTSNCRSMATTDNFRDIGRDSEGVKFSYYVNPGRKEAAEAFKAYQAGSKEPLAALIANGVNRAAESFADIKSNRFGYNSYGTILASNQLLSLLDKDPALKELAQKQGMEPERLETMKGMKKLNELETADRQNEKKLAEATAKHQELSKEEKRVCAKKILMSRLAMLQLKHHYEKVISDPNGPTEKLIQSIKVDSSNDHMKLPMEQWPLPEPGSIHWNGQQVMIAGIQAAYGSMPQIALDLAKPNGVDKLEQLADKILEQQKLAELPTAELCESLGHASKKQINLSSAVEQAMDRKAQPEREKNTQKIHQVQHDPVEMGGIAVNQQ